MKQLLWCCLVFLLSTVGAFGQSQISVPPGGATVIGPFGAAGNHSTIQGVEPLDFGTTYLSDDKHQIIYAAPAEVAAATPVTIAYSLSGESAPRSLTLTVDPNFSTAKSSATGAALEWLFLLLILALFIEAAVLFVASLIRNLLRLFRGKAALDPEKDGWKPSVYKPFFALALSGIAVYAFEIDPLNDIFNAFGATDPTGSGARLIPTADGVITALLVAGGAESVRRVFTGIMGGLGAPDASAIDKAAERADARPN